MYTQRNTRRSPGYRHWRNQERLEELEQLLVSDYLDYIDPVIVANMKRIIDERKRQLY